MILIGLMVDGVSDDGVDGDDGEGEHKQIYLYHPHNF